MWPVPLLIVRPSYDFLNLSLAESARTPATADFIKARANPLCNSRRVRLLFSFLPAGRRAHDPESGIVGRWNAHRFGLPMVAPGAASALGFSLSRDVSGSSRALSIMALLFQHLPTRYTSIIQHAGLPPSSCQWRLTSRPALLEALLETTQFIRLWVVGGW